MPQTVDPGQALTLAISCLALTKEGLILDACYYQKETIFEKAIHHHGDRKSDHESAGYESISIFLDKLPSNVQSIIFCLEQPDHGIPDQVTYETAHFQVTSGSMQVVDKCYMGGFALPPNGTKTDPISTIGICRRNGSKWEFITHMSALKVADIKDSFAKVADDEGVRGLLGIPPGKIAGKQPTFNFSKTQSDTDATVRPYPTHQPVGCPLTIEFGMGFEIMGEGCEQMSSLMGSSKCLQFGVVLLNRDGDAISTIDNHSFHRDGDGFIGFGPGRIDDAPEQHQLRQLLTINLSHTSPHVDAIAVVVILPTTSEPTTTLKDEKTCVRFFGKDGPPQGWGFGLCSGGRGEIPLILYRPHNASPDWWICSYPRVATSAAEIEGAGSDCSGLHGIFRNGDGTPRAGAGTK